MVLQDAHVLISSTCNSDFTGQKVFAGAISLRTQRWEVLLYFTCRKKANHMS